MEWSYRVSMRLKTRVYIRLLLVVCLLPFNNTFAAQSCEMVEGGHSIEFDPSIFDEKQRSLNCFVDWQVVKQSNIRYQWVDIRSEKEFSTIHINGSINIPSYAIKTKFYLKKRPLLVIDHGASYRRLWRLCSELKEAGFEQVNILKGGINTAVAEGYTANGNKQTPTLLSVTPSMAMEELFLQGAVFVTLSEKTQQRLLTKKIPSELVDYNIMDPSFFSEMGRLRYQRDNNAKALKSVVVIDDFALRNYGPVDSSKLYSNVYFLEGGADALLRYLETTEWSKYKRSSHPERFSCGL